MASKKKPTGCNSCRIIRRAARGDLNAFFEEAAKIARRPDVMALWISEAELEAIEEAKKCIAGYASNFQAFCDRGFGNNYKIPKWAMVHAERILGIQRSSSYRFRRDRQPSFRPIRAAGGR